MQISTDNDRFITKISVRELVGTLTNCVIYEISNEISFSLWDANLSKDFNV